MCFRIKELPTLPELPFIMQVWAHGVGPCETVAEQRGHLVLDFAPSASSGPPTRMQNVDRTQSTDSAGTYLLLSSPLLGSFDLD